MLLELLVLALCKEAWSCTRNPQLEHVPMDPVEEELEDVLMKT